MAAASPVGALLERDAGDFEYHAGDKQPDACPLIRGEPDEQPARDHQRDGERTAPASVLGLRHAKLLLEPSNSSLFPA
jgi:hypothetical protein